jgi:hypothetical protein
VPWDSRGLRLDDEQDVASSGVRAVKVMSLEAESWDATASDNLFTGTVLQQHSEEIIQEVTLTVLDVALVGQSGNDMAIECPKRAEE